MTMQRITMKMGRGIKVVLATMVLAGSAWFGAVPAAACPGCQTQGQVVELDEPQTVSASMALSWSVLFLLIVLAGVGGFLGVYIKKTVARVDLENARR